MLYARSDVRAFNPSSPDCPGHSKTADKNDPHFSVSCAVCEPELAHDPNWAPSPLEVPLTKAEEREREQAAKEAADRQTLASDSIGRMMERLLAQDETAQPKAGLDPDERAELEELRKLRAAPKPRPRQAKA